jgi:hypothetical protein
MAIPPWAIVVLLGAPVFPPLVISSKMLPFPLFLVSHLSLDPRHPWRIFPKTPTPCQFSSSLVENPGLVSRCSLWPVWTECGRAKALLACLPNSHPRPLTPTHPISEPPRHCRSPAQPPAALLSTLSLPFPIEAPWPVLSTLPNRDPHKLRLGQFFYPTWARIDPASLASSSQRFKFG